MFVCGGFVVARGEGREDNVVVVHALEAMRGVCCDGGAGEFGGLEVGGTHAAAEAAFAIRVRRAVVATVAGRSCDAHAPC